MLADDDARLSAWVHGSVQGVGFRWWTRAPRPRARPDRLRRKQAGRPRARRRTGSARLVSAPARPAARGPRTRPRRRGERGLVDTRRSDGGVHRAIAAAPVLWHVMHLKSLTLKGFKSFASPTTLRFEPGITCVVGPNGSGKSNVVDALTWVMGEQGAKTLRGGKMEDVIFAGTSSRAPLGRAEVTLTIDNSDNALPIEYSEVSITRRMFRDGAGEYEINGASCRLMDVQELLSDSGIGREMHVIVGQGKLSEILESRPEDRRAFIEEAAGVLKHRKRKEKAVRKLDSMSANLNRLSDLTTELRRQLKPLGRQAEMARRAQTIQADLRDARLRLAADDLMTRQRSSPTPTRPSPRCAASTTSWPPGWMRRRSSWPRTKRRWPASSGRAESAQQTWFRLSALAERVSATVRIATERAQLLDADVESSAGADPDTLEAEAEEVAAHERDLLERARRVAGNASRPTAPSWPSGSGSPPSPNARTSPPRGPRRTGAKGWRGWRARSTPCALASSRSTTAWRGLSAGIEESAARAQQAHAEFETVQGRVGALDAGEAGLDEQHDRSVAALRLADERVAELQAGERGAERQVAACGPASRRWPSAWTGATARPGFRKPQRLPAFRLGRKVGQGPTRLRGRPRGGAGLDGRRVGRRGLRCRALGRGRTEGGRRWPGGHRARRLAGEPLWHNVIACPKGRCGRSTWSTCPARCVARWPRCWPTWSWSENSPRRWTWWPPAGSCGRHRRGRPGRGGLGQRRLRSQTEHAGDHLGDREGARRVAGRRDGRPARWPPRCPARSPSRRPVRTPPKRRWRRSTNPTPRSRRSTSSSVDSARTPGPPRRSGGG